MWQFELVAAIFLAVALEAGLCSNVPYYGTRIGKFSTHFHGVKGDVYAVDDKTIFIKNFKYDGKGQDTFFWAGTSIRPDPSGFIIPDEKGSSSPLSAYHGEDLLLRLPEGRTVKDLRWLAVWSMRFRANFGSLIFPKSLQIPNPIVIGPLQNTKHGVSSQDIMILDTQTFVVSNFNYDGSQQGVYWWLSRGMKPNTGGLRLLDENGSDAPLTQIVNKTIVVVVPGDNSIFDFNTFSVWSSIDIEDYGSVKIPTEALVPPSIRSLGITLESKLNCEMLNDNLGLEIRWTVDSDQITMQLIGKIGTNEYMALGLSKDDTETKFTAADAAIAWLGPDGQGHAVDYFLQNTEKCEDGQGMCPDTVYNGADNSLRLLNAGKVKDSTMITFSRPLKAVDEEYDQHIFTDGPQAVLWAVGPIINQMAGPPKLRTRGNLLLDFGRDPIWNCPTSDELILATDTDESKVEQSTSVIHCPNDHIFRAQIGPSPKDDQKKVWFINGLPFPELVIHRGKTYTFIVEGGTSDPIHHPLYITSNAEGGLYQKIIEANPESEIIYAGVARDGRTGTLIPTAEGRLCEWSTPEKGVDYSVLTSETVMQQALALNCEPGNPGTLTWTPDVNTSDVIYYQSFMEKNLGGKIKIVDFCEESNPTYYLEELQRRQDFQTHSSASYGSLANSDIEKEADTFDLGSPLNHKIVGLGDPVDRTSHSSSFEKKEIYNLESVMSDKGEEKRNEQNGDSKTIYGISTKISPELENWKEFSVSNRQNWSNKTNKDNGTLDIFDIQNNDDHHIFTHSSLSHAASENKFSLPSYPHDESERSDVGLITAQHESKKSVNRNDKPLQQLPSRVHTYQADQQLGTSHLSQKSESTSQEVTKAPAELNVQFEGGFVPLILNPSKAKESASHPDYVPPPPHLRRVRPFLFNESIPFHGTFKPGVPDFSGFNISHYAQDSNALDRNHGSDLQTLLSAPKPQVIQRPIPPINNLPPELFRRPQSGFPRPQVFPYIPTHHIPPFVAQQQQQHFFMQLPPKYPQNFFHQTPDSEDLEAGSSQRVQISLQTPHDKNLVKNMANRFPIKQNTGHNRHSGIPFKIIGPSPPIQRRPDVVEDDEVAYQQSQLRPYHQNLHLPSSENSNVLPKQPGTNNMQINGIGRPLPLRHFPPRGNEQHPHFPFTQQRLPGRPEFALNPAPMFIQQQPPNGLPSFPRKPADNPFQYRLPNRPPSNPPIQPQISETNDYFADDSEQLTEENAYDAGKDQNSQSDTSEEVEDSNEESYSTEPSEDLESSRHKLTNHESMHPLLQSDHPHHIYLHRPPNSPINPELNPNDNYKEFNIEMSSNNNKNQKNNYDQNQSQYSNSNQNNIPNIVQKQPAETEEDYEEILHTDESSNIPVHYENPETGHEKASELVENINSEDVYEKPQSVSASVSIEKHEQIYLPSLNIQNENYTVENNDETKLLQPFTTDWDKNIPNLEDFHLKIKSSVNDGAVSNMQKVVDQPVIHLPDEHVGEYVEYIDYNNNKFVRNAAYGIRIKNQLEGTGISQENSTQFKVEQNDSLPSRREPQFSSSQSKVIPYIVTTLTSKPDQKQIKDTLKNYLISPPPKIKEKAETYDENNGELEKKESTKEEQVEKVSFVTYPGRKNILLSDPSNDITPPDIPPKAPENIKLPHISKNPPSHDNGTDYSILTHVLALIGDKPHPSAAISPRNLD